MLVDNNIYKKVYKGTGDTTAFPIPFPFLDNAHIQVLRSPDGVNEEVVPASEYTITGAGIEKGGTCTFKVAPTAGITIAVMRNVPITQLYAYRELDNFPAESHEDALAKLTMIDQQQQEQLNRALKVSSVSSQTPEELMTELFQIRDDSQAAQSAAEAAQSAAEAAQSAAETCRDEACECASEANATLESAITVIKEQERASIESVQQQEQASVEVVKNEGDEQAKRLEYIAKTILISAASYNKSVSVKLISPITNGETYTLPESLAYLVGRSQLLVSGNGVWFYKGFQYEEVGTDGVASTQIKFLQDLAVNDVLTFTILANRVNVITATNSGLVNDADGYLKLNVDGKTVLINASGQVYVPVMAGATGDKAGAAGLVPRAEAGQGTYYLTGEGKWINLVRKYGVVNVRMYDATGDGITDDKLAFKKAIEAAGNIKASLYIPNGKYKISSTLAIKNTNTDGSGAISICGESMSETILQYTGTGACISVENADSASGRSTYQTFKNFTLRGLNKASGKVGLSINRAAFLTLSHVRVYEFDLGVLMRDVDQFYADKLITVWNNRGIEAYRNTSITAGSTQPNNHTYVACTIAHNSTFGGYFKGGSCLNFYGGDVEQNGSSAPGSDRAYGLKFEDCGGEGGRGAGLYGVYFEANYGLADVLLVALTENLNPRCSCVHYISSDFKRSNMGNDTTHNILCNFGTATSIGDQIVVVTGSSFRAFWGYQAKNKVIAYMTKQPQYNTFYEFGNYYEVPEEKPSFCLNTAPIAATFYNKENVTFPAKIEQQYPINSYETLSGMWTPTIIDGSVIIPEDGVYNISVNFVLAGYFTAVKKLAILENGSVIGGNYIVNQGSLFITANVTRRLIKGTAISVNFAQYDESEKIVNGASTSATYITVTKVY